MKMPSLIRNFLTSRTAWLQKMLDPRRDIDKECGHPETVSVEDYRKAFKRGDIAKRVVCLFPDETWSEDPQVYETEDETETPFETAWNELQKQIPIYTFLHRADILSGIGRYGVVIIGIDDGLPLDQPVAGINERGEGSGGQGRKLIYLRPLEEELVKISELESDTSNPRYGLPTMYEASFIDPKEFQISGAGTAKTPGSVKVHWTRVVHLADNRTNNEVFGAPRMEVVFDRLLDLKKVAGGSGEMFWKGGFPGLSLETHPNLGEDVVIDKEVTREEMEKYMNGLQRYLLSENVTAKSLLVQVADPTAHVDTQLRLIGIALGVPWRILAGSEAAQLASEQDAKAWNKRLSRRRESYLSPYVLRPFVDRLILIGVLPNPAQGYIVFWGDLNSLNSVQQAEIANTRSTAMAKYVQSGADMLMAPRQYLITILGMTEKEADTIIAEADEHSEEVAKEEEDRLKLESEIQIAQAKATRPPVAPRAANGR